MRTAKNEDIEIRINLEKPSSAIEYRNIYPDTTDWKPTPFNAADATDEDDALSMVDEWLETSYSN
jgi:hypothetical protein